MLMKQNGLEKKSGKKSTSLLEWSWQKSFKNSFEKILLSGKKSLHSLSHFTTEFNTHSGAGLPPLNTIFKKSFLTKYKIVANFQKILVAKKNMPVPKLLSKIPLTFGPK